MKEKKRIKGLMVVLATLLGLVAMLVLSSLMTLMVKAEILNRTSVNQKALVVADDVQVRNHPSTSPNAEVIDTLYKNKKVTVLEDVLTDQTDFAKWCKIELEDHEEAYVAADFVSVGKLKLQNIAVAIFSVCVILLYYWAWFLSEDMFEKLERRKKELKNANVAFQKANAEFEKARGDKLFPIFDKKYREAKKIRNLRKSDYKWSKFFLKLAERKVKKINKKKESGAVESPS